MRDKCIKLLDQLNADLDLHFQKVRQRGEQWYTSPIKAGKWSPANFHEHLMLAESASMEYLKIKIAYPDNLKKISLKEKVRAQKLKLWLKSSKSAKAPELVVPTGKYNDFNLAYADWQKQREALLKLILEIPEPLLYTNIYKHPFVGKIGLHHMLQFYSWHFHRHAKQMGLKG